MAFINKLQAVTYNLDAAGLDQLLNPGRKKGMEGNGEAASQYNQALQEKAAITYTGFIAQDVEKAAKELNYNFSGVDIPKNDKDVYGLRYAEFVVPLVKAVQELSVENGKLKIKNEEVDVLKTQLINQQKQIDELKEALIKLVNQQKCVPTTVK